MLRMPTSLDELRPCVDLKDPGTSDVVENDMQVARVDDQDFTFIFVYASPRKLAFFITHVSQWVSHAVFMLALNEDPAAVQTGAPAL